MFLYLELITVTEAFHLLWIAGGKCFQYTALDNARENVADFAFHPRCPWGNWQTNNCPEVLWRINFKENTLNGGKTKILERLYILSLIFTYITLNNLIKNFGSNRTQMCSCQCCVVCQSLIELIPEIESFISNEVSPNEKKMGHGNDLWERQWPKHTVKVSEVWFKKNALWSRSGLTGLQRRNTE